MKKEDSSKPLSPYLEATHRQHFVKRKYLSQWSNNNVFLHAKKKGEKDFFIISLDDACVSNDIYTIDHNYNETEMCIIKNLYSKYPELLKDEFDNNLSIRQLSTSHLLKNIIKNPDMREKLSYGFDAQVGENRQTRVEESFFELIQNYVIKEDDSFLNDFSLKHIFVVGLATQYLRTKKIMDMTINGINMLLNKHEEQRNFTVDYHALVNPKAIWQATLEIEPYLIAYQLIENKQGISFLKSDEKFLTNDNPVTQIGESYANGKPKTIRFLYPVSPSLCIIYPDNSNIKDATDDEVKYINKMIADNCDLFVFRK